MGKPLKFTQEDAWIMNDLRSTGMFYKDIAKKFNTTRDTVKRVLKRYGLYEPPKAPNQNRQSFTKQERLDILRGFLEGAKMKDLAKKHNCSYPTIRKALENMGAYGEKGRKLRAEIVRRKKQEQQEKRKKVAKVTKPKATSMPKRVIPFPCPFIHCSDRKECPDIETPQKCIVWRAWFKDDGTLKETKKDTLKAINDK